MGNAAQLLQLGQGDAQWHLALSLGVVIIDQPVELLPESIHPGELLRLLSARTKLPWSVVVDLPAAAVKAPHATTLSVVRCSVMSENHLFV